MKENRMMRGGCGQAMVFFRRFAVASVLLSVFVIGKNDIDSREVLSSSMNVPPQAHKDIASRRRRRRLQNPNANCKDMISNGDFDDGTYEGWSPHDQDGTLVLFPDSVSGNKGDMSLMHTKRTDAHTGPEHELDTGCFSDEGDRLTLTAYVKLLKNNEPFQCDRNVTNADDPLVCPIMSLQLVLPDGKYHYKYATNTVTKEWQKNQWNEEHYYIDVDTTLTLALQIKMYVERVSPEVDIILDHVKVTEMEIEGNLEGLGIPDQEGFNETEMEKVLYNKEDQWSPNCTHMVINGDAEEGDTRGWSARHGGGKIFRYPDGYGDESGTALLHTARSSFIMGPQHRLVAGCLVEGKRYRFEAQMKLLDENGDPFECDKTHHWADDTACPVMSVQYTYQGKDHWCYFENEHPGPWVADMYNPYQATIMITREIRESSIAYFYFERVKAGVSIVWDQVNLVRDCYTLVPNGDAESQSIEGWQPTDNNGVIRVVNHTDYEAVKRDYSDVVSHAYFQHSGRKFPNQGPRNTFDVHCLVMDRMYSLSLYIKLIDSKTGDVVVCDRDAAPLTPETCPLVSLAFVKPNGQTVIMDLYNDSENITPAWEPKFNYYHAAIDVSRDMASATTAYIFIKGPPPHIDILFDDFVLEPFDENSLGCKEIVYNGKVERGITGWGTAVGTVDRYAKGVDGSRAIAHFGRTSFADTIRHRIDPTCLVEGVHYVFKALIRLFDEDMQPYQCNRVAKYGDEDFCTLATLYVEGPGGTQPVHLPNQSPAEWIVDGWNAYRNDFFITFDLAQAKQANLMVRGPRGGVVVVLDEVEIVPYVPPPRTCDQLLVNSDFEDFDINAWEPMGGAVKLHNKGVRGGSAAILHFNRPGKGAGMRQNIDPACLVQGKKFQFSAHFQLINENYEPIPCNSEAVWGADDYCILLSIFYTMRNGKERGVHFINEAPVGWRKDDFNFFSTVITVPADLSLADSAYVVIKGPRVGVSILADLIELKEYTVPQQSCNQMILNPNASDGDLKGWHPNISGYFSFYEYDEGKVAYKYYGRNAVSAGPKHYLDVTCFKEGDVYEVDALFLLLTARGDGYACDKDAEWRDPRFCILGTIDITTKQGALTRIHVGNAFQRGWHKDQLNAFRGALVVNKDLANAKEAYLYFQGPRIGSQIVFDHVTFSKTRSAS